MAQKPPDGNGRRKIDWDMMRQRIAAAHESVQKDNDIAPEVLQQAWSKRASSLAAVRVEEEEGNIIELVLVQLGREIYGFDVQHVFDIRAARQVTRVPRTPAWVAGVANVRGRILSAVDLAGFLGLRRSEVSAKDGAASGLQKQFLIVVETPGMEAALLVDNVLGVQAFLESQVQTHSGVIRGILPEYVQGIASRKDGPENLLVILNLAAVLGDKRFIITEEIS
jgi:purine-binding chemotaxis protein CheW